jgi:hypothetical protein
MGQKTWTKNVLYSFTGGSDGGYPVAGLIFDKAAALYGTTLYGGSSGGIPGLGNVFKLMPPASGQIAWTETTLYSFKGLPSDGFYPYSGLIADEQGALYSTTFAGGSGGNAGTVFKLTPPASGQTVWTETILYRFTGGADGGYPYAGLIADKQGTLYGTTFGGGSIAGYPGTGAVFKLTSKSR